MNTIAQSKTIKLVIDYDTLERYNDVYFKIHPRARKRPIAKPWHESINVWMIMKRPMMNALKQKWKDFIEWFVIEQGYANLHIEECEISQTVYYDNNRRHDNDNSVPKFILDGLVQGGMIVDDDSLHVTSLTLKCRTDASHPRTELIFKTKDNVSKKRYSVEKMVEEYIETYPEKHPKKQNKRSNENGKD